MIAFGDRFFIWECCQEASRVKTVIARRDTDAKMTAVAAILMFFIKSRTIVAARVRVITISVMNWGSKCVALPEANAAAPMAPKRTAVMWYWKKITANLFE